MKKIYTLCLILLSMELSSNAQNVLLFENFEDTTTYSNILITTPSGSDTTWIDYDYDLLPDASTTGTRPNEWFLNFGFADVDSTNTVMTSNSWTNDPTPVANYLILPPIHLTDNTAMLSWKVASFQQPRYVDGMQVLVSTTENFAEYFTDTLKIYGQYISGAALPNDSSFFSGGYVFSQDGFILGSDYQYVEFHGDSARFRGVLRPDSVSLAAYANQTIYIAFCHGTTDDNLISIDDIKVTGAGTVLAGNPKSDAGLLVTYPNPAHQSVTVEYSVPATQYVNISIYDAAGRLVKTVLNNMSVKGNYKYMVDISGLANGNYHMVMQNGNTIQRADISKQ